MSARSCAHTLAHTHVHARPAKEIYAQSWRFDLDSTNFPLLSLAVLHSLSLLAFAVSLFLSSPEKMRDNLPKTQLSARED